ncbi:MAG: hypothetical protein D6797_09165 [Bdellovibrio sp.]|nr:MAG: hypothetical protein D6797_09165 [Bdellovibrio sp.]
MAKKKKTKTTKKVAKKKTTAKKAVKKKKVTKKKTRSVAKPSQDKKSKQKPLKAKKKSTQKALEEESLKAAAPSEEILDLVSEETPSIEEVVLTDAEGRRYCKVSDCDQIANVDQYCRYHYLLYWKKIQQRKKILSGGKLERYIEELTSRYSDKYLEILKKDLRSEKDFLAAIHELELDEKLAGSSSGFEEEDKSYLDEIQGVAITNSESTDDEY